MASNAKGRHISQSRTGRGWLRKTFRRSPSAKPDATEGMEALEQERPNTHSQSYEESNVIPHNTFGEHTRSPQQSNLRDLPQSSASDSSSSGKSSLRMQKLSLRNADAITSSKNATYECGQSRKRECQQDSLKDLPKRSKVSNERIDRNFRPVEREQKSANRNDWQSPNQMKGQANLSTQQSHTKDHFQVPASSNLGNSARESGPTPQDAKRYSGQSCASMHTDEGGGDGEEGDTSMLLQPETKPITQEQLVNEVKGIYAGLVMVEKKCVEVCTDRAKSAEKLKDDQWQALIALHRTLLHEHHDHPTASAALRRLANKYAMPARMWRHGIHAFLELLRQQLPSSLDHMLTFVYIAYSMMALLLESVPFFTETWIECLGDLARYRMAIEEADLRDREIWSNVARMWYNKAADRSPNVGRIQHHLAVLARPNIVQQLFYYSKALVAVVPFTNARESIMLLFTPFLDRPKDTYHRYAVVESSLVTAWGIIFRRGSITEFQRYTTEFASALDEHISRTTVKWKTQGPEIESSLIAGMLNYGEKAHLWSIIREHMDRIKKAQEVKQEPNDQINTSSKAATATDDPQIRERMRQEHWTSTDLKWTEYRRLAGTPTIIEGSNFSSSDDCANHVFPVWSRSVSIVSSKIGDRNTIPYLHVTLAFLWSLSFVPGALFYLESYVPWAKLVTFLNTLGRSGVYDAQVESAEFPQSRSGVGRQLPEDFPIRGLIWSYFYYPQDFFTGQVVDEDERALELPSHALMRAERCLWLGVRLASLGRYMTYNVETKQFAATDFALSLANLEAKDTFDPSAQALVQQEFDAVMVEA